MNIVNWSNRVKVLALTFLVAAFGVTAGFAVQNHRRAEQYALLLDNGYRHAFAELTTAVGELDVALQKGVYTSSTGLFSSLCTQAYSTALSAQMALGELPYGNVELEQTAAFLAKTGDWAMAMARNSYQSGGCTPEERETLRALAASAGTLAQTLRQLQGELYTGAISLGDLNTVEARLSALTENGDVLAGSAFQTVESDFPAVPSLIYDGPFSEHLSGRTPKMLEGLAPVTQEDARSAAGRFLDLRPEIFGLVGEGGGNIPTWCFSATVDGGELYLEVTKYGGQILSVMSNRPVQEAALSLSEVEALASAFLIARGYPNLVESYYIDRDNILTINYAAAQNEVLCYPDLVKLSVALDTGSVVGFESRGYLMNHHIRVLPEPTITLAIAQRSVADGLSILSHRLVLIPTGGEYEVLCHEFKCETASGDHVIIYSNATTGQEEKILLLLEDESGTLAL